MKNNQKPKTTDVNKQKKKTASDAAKRQNSSYGINDIPQIDNNLFFEERSNPLSSKGN